MPNSSTVLDAEPSYVWDGVPPLSPALFEFFPPGVPEGAQAIHDETLDAIIGYRIGLGGVFRTYDLSGELQSIDELPLEAPLIDPLDVGPSSGDGLEARVKARPRGRSGACGGDHQSTVLMPLRAKYYALAKRTCASRRRPWNA